MGVEDKSHKIVALDHQTADNVILMIHRQIQARMVPVPKYDVSTIPIQTSGETRYVIQIYVPVSRNLPVTIHENGLLDIYVRNYGWTETATPEQIRDLVLISEQIPYDQPFTDQVFSKEDFTNLFRVTQDRGVKLTEKQLISIGFISEETFERSSPVPRRLSGGRGTGGGICLARSQQGQRCRSGLYRTKRQSSDCARIGDCICLQPFS